MTSASATTFRTGRPPGSRSSEASARRATSSPRRSSTSRGSRNGTGPRDEHGRFPASATCLDPLDPPLDRLRRKLGLEPRRWGGARFAVCLSHDVDIPWRWTRKGIRLGAGRLKAARNAGTAWREIRGLAGIPVHRVRGTDPNFSFERIAELERRRGASSVFFLMAAHRVVQDGPAPETYDRLRPRVVETLLGLGCEIGLHASYSAAFDPALIAEEKAELERLGATLHGQRYHYLRVDPHANLAPLADLGFAYDSSLGFGGAPGFRAGIAHPFRPWDVEHDRPLDLVEIPLAAMDVTLAEPRYLGLLCQGGRAPPAGAARLGGGARRRLLDPLAYRPLRPGHVRRLGPPLRAPHRRDLRPRRRLHARARACRGGGRAAASLTSHQGA